VVLIHNGVLLSHEEAWNLTCHLQVNWRTSFWARLAKLRIPKIYVLPHMWTLDPGQMQQCCWTWVTWQGESTYRRNGDR
jgi:hypothetical protein